MLFYHRIHDQTEPPVIRRFDLFLLFITRFCKQAEKNPEANGSGNSARRGLKAAGKGAEQPMIFHRLFHALCQRVAKAGEWDRCSGVAEILDFIIKPDGGKKNTARHIEHNDSGRCPVGFIDQNLSDHAQQTAHQENLQVSEQHIHAFSPFK